MLHECCVSAALHAAWSSRGEQFSVTFLPAVVTRWSSVGVQVDSLWNFQAFLSIEDDTNQPEESVFYQVQSLFGHLMESKLQYYVPENFWKVTDWLINLKVKNKYCAFFFFQAINEFSLLKNYAALLI